MCICLLEAFWALWSTRGGGYGLKEFRGKKSNKGSIRFGNRVAREGGREHEGMTRTISSIFAWDGSLMD